MADTPDRMSPRDRGVCGPGIRWIATLFLSAVLLAALFPAAAGAQSSSDRFRLTGGLSPGGGQSAGTSIGIIGSAVGTGGGLSWAGDRALYSGVIVMNFALGGTFLAYYEGSPLDTVVVSDRILRVAFGGGQGPVAGKFYSRLGGESSFSVGELAPADGDTLVIDVPADRLTPRGLEFFFALTRDDDTLHLGSAHSPYVYVTHVSNETGQRPAATPDSRYRMVSVPLHIQGSNSVQAVFEDDLGLADKTLWRLGSYINPGDSVVEFPDAVPVTPGRAYWLITLARQRYGADGYTVRPDRDFQNVGYYAVPLRRGWNQIANPFPFDLDWRTVLLDLNGVVYERDTSLIDDNAYWYSGYGYYLINTLLAWEGFFVFAKRTGLSVMFPYIESTMGAAKAAPARLSASPPVADWLLELTLEAEGLIDDGNFAGVSRQALDGADEFDAPEPPPAPEAPSLSFRLPDNDPFLRRCDIRRPFNEGSAWIINLPFARSRRLTITGVEKLPDNLDAVMILDVGQTTIIRGETVVDLPSDVRSARLVVGNRDFTEEELASVLPHRYELMQNFPNPFNPYTNIRFALPRPTTVLLEVYNLLGQRVATLMNGPMEAGTHTVVWNGVDSDGRQVATGVYFYRLTTPDYTDVMKMLMLK